MEKLWVNVSFQSQIVLGVKHQRAGNFETMNKRRSLCGRQKMMILCNEKRLAFVRYTGWRN